MSFNESIIEYASLEWFGEPRYIPDLQAEAVETVRLPRIDGHKLSN